jgi:hypothetical protein
MPENSPNPDEETTKLLWNGTRGTRNRLRNPRTHLFLDFSRFPLGLGGQELKNSSPLQQDGYSGKGRGIWRL